LRNEDELEYHINVKVDILMAGKIQEKPYRLLVEEYLQRCSRRCAVEVVPCRNEQEMEKRLEGKEYVLALDEHGKTLDSLAFSRWLAERMNSGISRMTVVLGPAEGLTPRMRALSHDSLRVSTFTLNHQLALLVFAEQLYRGLSILFGEPYHKA
jgi:23S rRNA (pseudouridine1915-N3)-methyltransferase